MQHIFLLLFFLLLISSAPAQAPDLMLATVYEGENELSDYWVSEKLDGVRGHWDGRTLWSRGGYAISAPDWFTSGWPGEVMDGELWIGRGRFEEVSAIVRRNQNEDSIWAQVKFMLFDLPEHPGNFDARLVAMKQLVADAAVPWLQIIEQFRVADANELDQRLEDIVAAGGEGLMLHHGSSHYRAGRSQLLLKYKPYQDAEARVLGYTEGKGKYAGMVGALIVENANGQRFRLGSGLSDADRANPPPLGSQVTYRYNGLTSKGLPRFARYVRVRSVE